MPLTIDIWKRCASAIEAHLAFRGIDIADWHQGTVDDNGRQKLSSRKLLTLLEHIPEVGGRWPVALRIAKDTHKEVALHRAALYAGGPNEYVPELYLDPEQARELVEQAQAENEAIQEATDDLFDSLGFT